MRGGGITELAADPRYVGGRLGCLAVLQTWTQAMLYHPHVHMLVTAGGLSADGTTWIKPKNPAFLVPVHALSGIFRAKICAALKKAGLLQEVPSKVWKKNWVVHCQPAGSGQKVLDYLGRYVFRLAISNSRLEQIDRGHVTFPYRDNRSHQMRRVTLPGEEFIVASSSMCSPAVAPTCDTMASAAVPVASNWIKPKLYSTLHNPRQSMIPYWMLPSLSCLPLRQPAAPTAKSAS